MKLKVLYLALISLIVLFSCRKDVGKVNRGNYPDDIGKIISLNCAVSGCHNALSSKVAGGYNMESWETAFSGANSGSPMIPYNSAFSSLCYYINTYSDLGLQNTPTMPLNGAALSHQQVKRIKDWIDAGAPDMNGQVKWADNPQRKKLYAVNQGCDVVTVFDSDTQLPIRFIHVGTKASGNTPHQVRVSPDGKYWYVIFVNNNIMQKYSCTDDRLVGNIPLTPLAAGTSTVEDAQDWNTFVISKDSKRAYCVSWTLSGKVAAVDLENMKLLHFLGGQTSPHGIALNATEDKMYVTAQNGNYLTEIDTGFTYTNLRSLENNAPPIDLPTLQPHDLILSPDNQNLMVTCQKSNDVRVFNISSASVTQIIPTGTYPQEIVYSESTNQYFVTCTDDTLSFSGKHGTVTRISSNYATTKIACGFQPHGIAVDETKKLIYVLSRNIIAAGPAPHHTSQCAGRNGFVNFIDLNSFTVSSKRYELSVDPYFIYARP